MVVTRRQRLIKALIHYHHRTIKGRWGKKRKEPILRKLRSKIAEKDQYK